MSAVLDLAINGPRAALAFLPTAWTRAWAALALVVLFLSVRLTAAPGSLLSWVALAGVVLAIFIALGALYRLGLHRDAGLGPAGLQFGAAEGRLMLVALLTAVFLFVLGLLAFTVILAAAYAVAAAGAGFVAADLTTWPGAVDDRGRIVVGVIATLAGAGMAWSTARVALGSAATVALDRVQVLSVWPVTRGVAWGVVMAAALAAAPGALGFFLVDMASRAGAGAPPVMAAARALVVAFLWLPLSAGLWSYIYRRLASEVR